MTKIVQARQISISEKLISNPSRIKSETSQRLRKYHPATVLYIWPVCRCRPLTTCSRRPLSWERCAQISKRAKRQEKCRPKASGRRCERGHRISACPEEAAIAPRPTTSQPERDRRVAWAHFLRLKPSRQLMKFPAIQIARRFSLARAAGSMGGGGGCHSNARRRPPRH